MRYLLLLLALVCGTAHAQWTEEQRTLAGMYMVAHVIDWGQSRRIARDGWTEFNPILGRHPSMGRVNTYFVLTPLIGALVLDAMPSRHRTAALKVVTTLQIATVARNHYLGIRVSF